VYRRILNIIAGLMVIASCDSAHSAPQHIHTTTDSARADSVARAHRDSLNRVAPGYVIDSVLPVGEEMRRFRNAIGGVSTTRLENASPSREQLIRRFVRDLANRDSVDLKSGALSAREFIDLVYPSSPNTHAPYRQNPGFMWMQINGQGASGLTRALQRRGGQSLSYVGHSCEPKQDVQGTNKLWLACMVHLASLSGDTTVQRLFGSIIERDGRFKFVSFANQF
jgi:hypothetical protein